jgi:hypothetical protein
LRKRDRAGACNFAAGRKPMTIWPGALLAILVPSLVPILLCIAAGSGLGAGRLRWPGADMLVGFGLLGTALTIVAVTTRIPVTWIMAGLALLALATPLVARKCPGGRATWIALALVLPILAAATRGEAAMWDEFWNWLPSAAHIYQHDSLPRGDLPPALSIFPGYPQAMPLMIAASSFLAQRFLEASGPILNVALLAGASATLAQSLAAALARRGSLNRAEMPLILIAGAVAITVLLNPGLNGAVVLSAYVECATMVAVGALGLVGVEILTRLSAHDSSNVEAMSWRFGFIGAMLVNLKQANPALLLWVVCSLVLIALRNPGTRTRRAVLLLPRMLLPPLVLIAVWRWYVIGSLSNAEQSFRPFVDWNFGVLKETFASIWAQIVYAPVFHTMMWSVTAAGIWCFFALARKNSEARCLAAVCAIVWLGYNAFLLIVYLGAMSASDAQIAADYWRYTPHAALLALYPPAMALAVSRPSAWMQLRRPAATVATILLALCTLPLRRDLNDPPGRAWQRFLRGVALDIRAQLPSGAKLLIVPSWNGPFAVGVRYDLWQLGMPERETGIEILWHHEDYAQAAIEAKAHATDYLLVQDVEPGPLASAGKIFGLPAIHQELALFHWRQDGWEKVKSWPVPSKVMQDAD